jgi:hypothetical protein
MITQESVTVHDLAHTPAGEGLGGGLGGPWGEKRKLELWGLRSGWGWQGQGTVRGAEAMTALTLHRPKAKLFFAAIEAQICMQHPVIWCGLCAAIDSTWVEEGAVVQEVGRRWHRVTPVQRSRTFNRPGGGGAAERRGQTTGEGVSDSEVRGWQPASQASAPHVGPGDTRGAAQGHLRKERVKLRRTFSDRPRIQNHLEVNHLGFQFVPLVIKCPQLRDGLTWAMAKGVFGGEARRGVSSSGHHQNKSKTTVSPRNSASLHISTQSPHDCTFGETAR